MGASLRFGASFMRAARPGQAVRAPGPARARARRFGRSSEPRSYARYPHYPQAESAWNAGTIVTLSGCGRDNLPATEGRLPSHSPGRDRPPAFGPARGSKRKAGRLTKPPPGGSCGLALSECESGMLREAPIGTKGPRTGGTGQAGHRTFGSRTSPAESGTSVRALPPVPGEASASSGVGQDRASARELRTRQ